MSYAARPSFHTRLIDITVRPICLSYRFGWWCHRCGSHSGCSQACLERASTDQESSPCHSLRRWKLEKNRNTFEVHIAENFQHIPRKNLAEVKHHRTRLLVTAFYSLFDPVNVKFTVAAYDISSFEGCKISINHPPGEEKTQTKRHGIVGRPARK